MNLSQKLYAGFLVSLLLVLAIGVVNYQTMKTRKLENQALVQSYETIQQLTSTEKLLVDMETARRGYRITGREEFLTPYLLARPQLDLNLAALKSDLNGRNRQEELLRKLELQIAGMRAFYLSQVQIGPEVRRDSLNLVTNMEKQMMDSARILVNRLLQAETARLEHQQEVTNELFEQASLVIIAGTIITEILMLVLFLAILRALNLRRNTQHELQAKMQEMEHINQTVGEKNWLLTGISQIKDKLQGATDTNQLALQVLEAILKYVGAPGGAIYIMDEEDRTHLLLAGSIGVPTTAQPVIQVGRGLVGSVAKSEQTVIINDVPSGYWRFESMAGGALPGSLLLVPFCSNHQLRGIIELASFGPFSHAAQQLIEEVATNIAVAFSAIAANNHATRLLMQVREQKEALEQQQEELRQTNEALTRQAEELQVSEEELRVQEEELRQVNAELQEKNKAMEAARHDLEEQAGELAQSSRYKSEFLANMSHELRTPLNAVLLLARILADNKEGNLSDRQEKLAATIHKSGEDLLDLINDILDLSKIEAGKATLNMEPTLLSRTIRHITDQVSLLAEEKRIEFQTTIAEDVPEEIYSDPLRLSQVLKNLLSNAFKFTPAGGKVTLRAEMAGDQLCFSVSDTGIGIPKDKQQLIFEAFQQADGSTSRRFGGTGLGLSISREIAKLLGGTIRLESTEGMGSTFTICLPLTEVPDDLPVPEHLPVTGQTLVADDRHHLDAQQPRVLIIEDDTDFATLLSQVARDAGYQVIVALRGDEGLHCARQFAPQAILLDMHLPGLNGWQLFRIFQEDSQLKNIPVHIISGMEGKLPEGEGLMVLKKPLNKQALEAAFQKIAGGQAIKGGRALVFSLNTRTLERQLQERIPGLRLTAVQSLEAAATELARDSFDCLIVDMGASVREGIAALQQLQTLLSAHHTPVIIYMDGEVDAQGERTLKKLSDVVIYSGEKSEGRLQDEVELFLSQVGKQKSESRRLPAAHTDEFFKGRKVLVADDDMRNLFAMSTLLEEQGIEVVAAADGQEALTALETNPDIEVALVDVMMPEIDGYQLIKHLRQDPRWSSLPIITLTAKAMAGDREESMRAGASDYISKPVESQKLLSLLRIWLAG